MRYSNSIILRQLFLDDPAEQAHNVQTTAHQRPDDATSLNRRDKAAGAYIALVIHVSLQYQTGIRYIF